MLTSIQAVFWIIWQHVSIHRILLQLCNSAFTNFTFVWKLQNCRVTYKISTCEIQKTVQRFIQIPSHIPAELKQRVEQWALKSINVLILFGIRRNCLTSGRSRSLYLFLRRVIKHCSNYIGISLLPNMYKMLSNILLSRLAPYAEEIIGDHKCGFQYNRSTTDHIFCIHQLLEKKWEYNEAVHQLFIDFKKFMIKLGGRYSIIL